MSDVEMTLKIGGEEFHARGPQEWVSERSEAFIERLGVGRPKQGNANSEHLNLSERDEVVGGPPPRAVERWLKLNEISDQQIAQVFDRGRDGFELILGDLPGGRIKDQIVNAYLLMGIKAFLETGESFFADKEARTICERFGCLDSKHHAEYLEENKGNRFSGSKEQGWKLTAPGMSAAAALIKILVD